MALKKKSARQSTKRTSAPKRAPASKRTSTSQRTAVSKRTPSSKKVTSTRKTQKPQRSRPSRASKVTVKTLDALNERLDMILPEVMVRIAAIEHLLVKNQLCMYDELINARQFIQEQERS